MSSYYEYKQHTPDDESQYLKSSMGFDVSKPSFQPFSLPPNKSAPLVEPQIQDIKKMRFPVGLAQAMNENNVKFPLRVWIIDNSTSMKKDDGTHISSAEATRLVHALGGREMRETVLFHAEMAAKVQTPTIFRLLNKPFSTPIPRQFGVAPQADLIEEDLKIARDTMRKVEPKGCTSLSKRVHKIRNNIVDLQRQLELTGEKVVMVLATDGLPTN
jgi:hypothetical protein